MHHKVCTLYYVRGIYSIQNSRYVILALITPYSVGVLRDEKSRRILRLILPTIGDYVDVMTSGDVGEFEGGLLGL